LCSTGRDQLALQVALVGGVPVPWKPNSVLPPADSWPLYETLAKRTVPVLPVAWAFHVLVTAEPPGTGTETDQPVTASEPAVIRTVVTNPPFQALLVTVAVQPRVAGAEEAGADEAGAEETGADDGGCETGAEDGGCETGGDDGGGVVVVGVR
jgi:hypothetical protein